MLVEGKARVTFDEDVGVVTRLDEIAKRRGITRSGLIRSILRESPHLFLPDCSSEGTNPHEKQTPEPAPADATPRQAA